MLKTKKPGLRVAGFARRNKPGEGEGPELEVLGRWLEVPGSTPAPPPPPPPHTYARAPATTHTRATRAPTRPFSRFWNSAPKRRAPTRTKARNRTADGPELTPHYSSNSHRAYPQDFAAPIPRIGARLKRNAKQYPVRARWNRLGLKRPDPSLIS